jgi:hypothetical protein
MTTEELLALRDVKFARDIAAYTWRTMPDEIRGDITLEDYIERVTGNIASVLPIYRTYPSE